MNLWANGTTSIGTYTAPSGNYKTVVGYGGLTLLGDAAGTEGGELNFQPAPGYNSYSIDLLGNDPRMFSVDTFTRTFGISNYGSGVFNLSVEGDITAGANAYKPGGGAWTASSDARLKDIDGPYDQGLSSIVRLNTLRYHYKQENARNEPSDRQFYGLIALDVEKIFPEAVSQGKDGYLSLDTTPINFAMINAIKELKSTNDNLKAENTDLRSALDELRGRVDRLEYAK